MPRWKIPLVRFPRRHVFITSWLTCLTLALRTILRSAQRFRSPDGEYPIASESIAFDMMTGSAATLTVSPRRQESPNGLSLTSQFVNNLSSLEIILTTNSRPKAIGTLPKPLQLEVSPLPYSPFPLLPLTSFSRRTRSRARHGSCLIN